MVIRLGRRAKAGILATVAAIMIIAFCFSLIVSRGSGYTRETSGGVLGSRTVIVDAGHGGFDGGASARDGTVEKDINLSIALKLRDVLDTLGYSVIMTRETDRDTADESEQTVRRKKVSDIKNRMKIIEENPDALFVSIHQNHYGGEIYHGTQVFYSNNDPNSELLAKNIQQTVKALLQPQNERAVKKTGTEIFLLYHARIPAVMVECGFLSNAEEAKKLEDDGYQSTMALSIACGITNYLQHQEIQAEVT